MTRSVDPFPAPPVRFREPLFLGPIRLASRFTLAPLAGYTNYPFRRSIREIGGVGLCTTDLVNARAIVEGSKKTLQLLATGPDDRPLAVQIFGGNPDEMVAAAKKVGQDGVASVDINMGCPVRKVVRVGGGSAMMCDTTGTTVDLVRRVVEAVLIPVTVKMRLGWDAENLTAPYFAREFEKAGVAAVTVHGRTREQGFDGRVDHAGIRAVVEAVERIPIFGNGDVMTIADAAQMIEETGCAGVAIGRGALANPWIFHQLQSWIEAGVPSRRATYSERIEFMRRHLERLCEWRANEKYGCADFRKVAIWYGKALRVSKETRRRLSMLSSLEEFAVIEAAIRDTGPPLDWTERDAQSASIDLPSGPIAHW